MAGIFRPTLRGKLDKKKKKVFEGTESYVGRENKLSGPISGIRSRREGSFAFSSCFSP